MRGKLLSLLELLIKYGFNMVPYSNILTKLYYRNIKIIKYQKIDNILWNTAKMISNIVDFNDYIDDYSFVHWITEFTMHLHNPIYVHKDIEKIKLFFECGFSIKKYAEKIGEKYIRGSIIHILNGIVNNCTHAHASEQFIKLFVDYCDDDNFIVYIRDRIPQDNQFHKFINIKLAIMDFIKTHTGYVVNRNIMAQIPQTHLMLLIRKTIRDNNLKTIILYKIIPLLYM